MRESDANERIVFKYYLISDRASRPIDYNRNFQTNIRETEEIKAIEASDRIQFPVPVSVTDSRITGVC